MNRLSGLLPIDFGNCCQDKNRADRDDDPCLANSERIATEEAKQVCENGGDDAAGEFGAYGLNAVGEYITGGGEADRGASRHDEPVRQIKRPAKSTLQNMSIEQERWNDQCGGKIGRCGKAECGG